MSMYKIIGKRKVDFVTEDSLSRHIVGSTVWYGIEMDSVEGYQVEKAFVSPDVVAYKDIPVDEVVDITFNHKGKITSIDAVII